MGRDVVPAPGTLTKISTVSRPEAGPTEPDLIGSLAVYETLKLVDVE